MIDPELKRDLESGSALIVGTVSSDLEPRATRAIGVRVLDGEPLIVRLLLDASDQVSLHNMSVGSYLAITGGGLESCKAVQLKCRSLGLEALNDADISEGERQRGEFIATVARSDGQPRKVLEAVIVRAQIVCVAEVLQLFDQTPGPQAGEQLPL